MPIYDSRGRPTSPDFFEYSKMCEIQTLPPPLLRLIESSG
jgi:hypothetical protein